MPAVGTTHHVRIGADYFLIKPGSYRKRQAPLFGPRFATGDPDWNNLSFWQHWVQHCWVGGFDAKEWSDDAMFDKSAGVDTSYHEVLLLSRDLGPNVAATRTTENDKFSAEGGVGFEREFFAWSPVGDTASSALYCLSRPAALGSSSYLHRWSGTVWVLVRTFASKKVGGFARWSAKMYFGTEGATVDRMTGNPGSEVFDTLAKPGGLTDVPYVIRPFRDRVYFGFGNKLWRMKLDHTWDGSTVFFEAGGVDYLYRATEHLGFLYLASWNGHILRTDANNTFDMWKMEGMSRITDLRSFDGRLFMAVIDPLEGTTASEAVLYQFSGAAVTELKRFGKIGVQMSLGHLRVVGGRMFFGASSLFGFQNGFGLCMYDPVEDSYHIFATNGDGTNYPGGAEQVNWVVDDVLWYRGYLWASIRGQGIFRTTYTVRDVQSLLSTYDTTTIGGVVAALNGGWLSSSEFDAGTPGLTKLWSRVTMAVDLPSTATSVYLEYSLDGGATWVSQGAATKTGTATRYNWKFQLGAAATGGVYGSSFKYRLTLRTTDTTKTPAVRGVIVRYLPVPEPNWVWDMVLVLSDTQHLLDGTIDLPNNVAKLAALEASFRVQSLVHYQDIDGTKWATGAGTNVGALIQSVEEIVPFLGPTSAGAIEREIRIQLIEAVETYEL